MFASFVWNSELIMDIGLVTGFVALDLKRAFAIMRILIEKLKIWFRWSKYTVRSQTIFVVEHNVHVWMGASRHYLKLRANSRAHAFSFINDISESVKMTATIIYVA